MPIRGSLRRILIITVGGLILLALFRLNMGKHGQDLADIPLNMEFPIVVLFWPKWFGADALTNSFTDAQCPFPSEIPEKPEYGSEWCKITHDRELIDKAAVIGFHLRDYNPSDQPVKKSGQPWVLMTQESPLNDFQYSPFKRIVFDRDHLQQFEYSMTYRLDSDIPHPYMNVSEYRRILSIKYDDFKQRKSITDKSTSVLWVASNCESTNDRESYMQELMKHLPVDSLGRCLNNGAYPRDIKVYDLMKRYKFYLALENSNCKDYVTEKMYNAFSAGVIPIVWGPSGKNGIGYEKHVPTMNSAIYVEDYTPAELAELVKSIDADERLWKERQSYRFDEKFSETFKRYWGEDRHDRSFCGLCRKAAVDRWNAVKDVRIYGKIVNVRGTHVLPDLSCIPKGDLE